MDEPRIIIVGAGMAGLACAVRLFEEHAVPVVVEAADEIGGRVRTDRVEGCQLDRGFQVFLDGYPTAGALLRKDRLELAAFRPGAMIGRGGRLHTISDPVRDPGAFLATAFSSIPTWADKVRVARLKARLRQTTLDAIWSMPEETTEAFLVREGFSPRFIEAFFRPFYGGIFLEKPLATSARMFAFVFKMFGEGRATLPREGIQALPTDLAARLPQNCLRLRTPVASVGRDHVVTESGDRLTAQAVVVATDDAAAAKLLREETPSRGAATDCYYFLAEEPPVRKGYVILNGASGLVNHVAIPTNVQPSYAPEGKALICVNVVEPEASAEPATAEVVRAACTDLFGRTVTSWRFLRSYRVERALPDQRQVSDPQSVDCRHRSGVYRAGDYLANGSLEAAVVTGQRAAEAIIADLTG